MHGFFRADHAGKLHLTGGGGFQVIRDHVAVTGFNPAAIDQNDITGGGFKRNQGLIGRTGCHRAHAQQRLILIEILPGEVDAGPFFIRVNRAVFIEHVLIRHGVGFKRGFELVVALNNVIILVELPRC